MPAYWQWLNRITPTTWILYALASNQVLRPPHPEPFVILDLPSLTTLTHGVSCRAQLGDINTPITDYSGQQTTVSGFLRSYFEYKHSFEWICVVIVGGWPDSPLSHHDVTHLKTEQPVHLIRGLVHALRGCNA